MVYYLAQGFRNLDRNKVFHGDIKLDNILIDAKGIAKIIAFKNIKFIARSPFESIFITDPAGGTPVFMAPEIFLIS